MLRRDEVCGDLAAVIQECGTYGRSNKSLISLAGAAGPESRPEHRLRCWLKHRKSATAMSPLVALAALRGCKRSRKFAFPQKRTNVWRKEHPQAESRRHRH